MKLEPIVGKIKVTLTDTTTQNDADNYSQITQNDSDDDSQTTKESDNR